MRLVSYNIHGGVGGDGRRDPERIADLLLSLAPDVVALQEVDSRISRGGLDQAGLIARRLGMELIEGPLLREHRGHYGNALLARWPLRLLAEGDFAAQGLERRGWLAAEVVNPRGVSWRVLVTHLDLVGGTRSRQLAELVTLVGGLGGGPLALAGDLNEWRPWRRGLGGLPAAMELLPPRATFPAWWPCLALDRLAVKGAVAQAGPAVLASPLARCASDHLPLHAELAPFSPRLASCVP